MGRTGKAWQKRKAGWMKSRHEPWNKAIISHNNRSPAPTSTTSTPVKPLKRLTRQEFNTTFQQTRDQFLPRAEDIIGVIPGAALRPLADTRSEVDDILKKKDPRGEISGYSEVHLATCVKAIKDCIVEHHSGHDPECKSPGH